MNYAHRPCHLKKKGFGMPHTGKNAAETSGEMKRRTDEARLEIDGADVPLSGIWVHSQTDPYPGGHRYTLRIPRPRADSWLANSGLSWDDLRDAGLWFQSLVGELAGSSSCATLFTHVLNTIDKIEKMEGQVEIQGVCSPFVRAGRK